MCAKHYENPTMLSKVTAKNVVDVFETHCRCPVCKSSDAPLQDDLLCWTFCRMVLFILCIFVILPWM